MSSNTPLAILSTAILLASVYTGYEVQQLKEFNVKQSNILAIKKKTNDTSMAKSIIANEPRIANIINYEMGSQNITQLSPALVDKTLNLSYEFIEDSLDDSFYNALTSVGFSDEVINTEDGYNIRNKWTMFVDANSPFHQDFPKGSILVYNNESFPLDAKCGNEPQIIYAPLSARNVKFDADFIPNDTLNTYRVSFKGNFSAIKDRVIIKVYC